MRCVFGGILEKAAEAEPSAITATHGISGYGVMKTWPANWNHADLVEQVSNGAALRVARVDTVSQVVQARSSRC